MIGDRWVEPLRLFCGFAALREMNLVRVVNDLLDDGGGKHAGCNSPPPLTPKGEPLAIQIASTLSVFQLRA